MVAKVVKVTVVSAALGLASFRVYATAEEKTKGQITPQQLSIYSTESPGLRYVEEKPGQLQTGLGLMRVGLQPYVRAVQNTCTSGKRGVMSVYHAGLDTYEFLKDPPPGFLPRVGVIAMSGLAGLVLARKGSRLKRIGVPLVLTAAGVAVCYPVHTVGVLKVMGKKVYACSSWVASTLQSKPKEEYITADHASEDPDPVTEVTTEVSPQPVLGIETPSVDPVVELITQHESAPVSGDVAPEVVSHASKTEESPGVKEPSLFKMATSEESSPWSQGSGVAPEVPPAEAVVVKGVSSALDVASDVEDLPESVVSPLIVDEAEPPAAENLSSPPVKVKPQFIPDPSLLDHGQAHPEDADLYSTRG